MNQQYFLNRAVSNEQKRIILDKLYELWCKNCYQRLGQLITNSLSNNDDLFYIEDTELIDLIQGFSKNLDLQNHSQSNLACSDPKLQE